MVRVLTAFPACMLQELLGEQVARAQGFLLVGNAVDPDDLTDLAAETEADVVICLLDDAKHIPENCYRLLDRFPHILIVGVLREADAVVTLSQEVRHRLFPSIGVNGLLAEIGHICDCDVRNRPSAPCPEINAGLLRLSLN